MSQDLKGKAGIRAFLLRHIGEIVTTEQVRDASGNQVQYSRRLRELRDEEATVVPSALLAKALRWRTGRRGLNLGRPRCLAEATPNWTLRKENILALFAE